MTTLLLLFIIMKTSRLIRFITNAYFIVFVSCFSYAQIGIKWQKHFGGSEREFAPALIKTPDNNLIIFSKTESNDYDASSNHGQTDILIIKTDLRGNKIWSRCYGGASAEPGWSLTLDENGNLIVCSETGSTNGDVPPITKGLNDRWVFKLNPDGDFIWSKRFGGSLGDEGSWVKIKTNGNIVTGGSSYSNDQDVPCNYGDKDDWILELSPDGEIVNNKVLGTVGYQQTYSGIATSDGGVLIASTTMEVGGMITGTCYGLYDTWLIKLDKDNNIEWQGLYGGDDEDDFVMDIIELKDGYVLITNTRSTTDHTAEGGCMKPDISRDTWLFKIDLMGNFKWGRCIGLPDIKEEQSLFQTWNLPAVFKGLFPMEDGGFMVFASSPNPRCVAGLQSPSNPSGLSITRTDSLGYIIWQQVFGDEGDIYAGGAVNIGTGRWIVASQANLNSFCDATVKGYGSFDIWLTELRECEYYKTSLPEGDTRVCVNLQPTSEYVTHPYFDAKGYLWVIDPAEAGVASNTDSITTITWNPNFEGTAKLSVRLDTECGIIQPSDTLEVEVHRDCIGVEDLAMQAIKLYFQPNPANESSVLHYTLPVSENKARLELYDLSGQMVYSAELRQHEGTHIIPTGNLKGGVYMCSIVSGREKGVGRLVVVK